MFIPKRKAIKGTFFGALLVLGAQFHTFAASSGPTSDKLLDRPNWLPELPKINNSKFALDSTRYIELRKRILEKHDKTAVKELYALAQKNHIPSIVLMGYIYDNDVKVVKVNHTTAAQYWAVGAKAGDAASLYNLGILYLNGRGVPRNLDTADKLLKIASDKGLMRSNYVLGQLFEQRKQYTMAITQYSKCLPAKSLPQCKTRYAILHVTRVKMTPAQAKNIVNILASTSRQGDLEATYTLARLAAEGIVLNKSPTTMVYYLEAMVKYPNSTPYYKKLALNMYKAYRPTEQEIKQGKENYRIGNAGGVSIAASFKNINVKETIIDAGNVYE